ncbi:WASH complex subunit 3-like [Watersipora subatra]|uniref:WASH complex subunit 3-like n=1 Tax=Watersipora subatra TaxID=2589382 RepID=UPI00355C087F
MDQDGLPIVGTGIDYTKVKPLDQKRLLAFINHYVTHTVQFLNHFSGVCEEKMTKIESQLHRLEITMCIIETKLSSIPGMDAITLAEKPSDSTDNAAPVSAPAAEATAATPAPAAAPAVPQETEEEAAAPIAPEPDLPKISQDPRYIKFFKMLNMGVPPPAVKMKMKSEGFNPDLLDTPDAPAPAAELIGDDSDSEASFTDSD